MMGKTHVVASLAAAHAGLLMYLNNRNVIEIASEESPLLYGVPVDSPLSLTTYGLVMVTVLMFVLLLLRVGNWHTYTAYTVVGSMILTGLYFVPSTTYGFQLATIIIAFALGALLPDIDSENSTIGKYFLPISKAIPHRTITHTLWAVLLVGGIGWYIDSIHVMALAAGYTLHILQDTFSKQGIAWFYPIGGYDTFSGGGTVKRGRKSRFGYRTGGVGEMIVFYGSIAVHVVCVGLVVWLGVGIM